MEAFAFKILAIALAIFVVGRITKLYQVEGFFTSLISALLLAIVNAVIRPIFIFLTFPITILTLGIFLLFINGFMLLLVSSLVPKFQIRGCFTAAVASIFISLFTLFFDWIFRILM
jgi:putative membrane protein